MLSPQSQEINFIKFARIMPNVPMAVGSGICLYSFNNLGENMRHKLVKLLQSCGTCEEVPENLMDSLGSLTACGPAYVSILKHSIMILNNYNICMQIEIPLMKNHFSKKAF